MPTDALEVCILIGVVSQGTNTAMLPGALEQYVDAALREVSDGK